MVIKNFSTTKELEITLERVLKELKNTILCDLDFKQAKLLTYWLNDWNDKFLKSKPHLSLKI